MRLTGRSRPMLRRRLACAAARAVPGAHPAQPGCVHYGIFIGVDGLSAGLLRGLIGNDLAGAYTHVRRFGYEGVTTFNARSDYTHEVTLPNRMTLSTGRPVLQPAGQLNTVHRSYTNH